ncbi:HD domain-containing protein [Frankia sp. AgB32]|uniref:HD domain-containing protein n=1 Tax=Frankia sp. AgB32 TaxID=631119 RepID=UPI00200F031A|nr:HD domain-containing protein [Frankia sp. AgB32]MCK9896762.1 HD domain-containing protein [Frankia sp. AgB32]
MTTTGHRTARPGPAAPTAAPSTSDTAGRGPDTDTGDTDTGDLDAEDLDAEDLEERLHRRHAPSTAAFTSVHRHCRIVWDIAASLLAAGAAPGADRALVRTGALLHDIGVYPLYDTDGQLDHTQYLRHGVLGHDLLAAERLPAAVCRFASCHTGVGLTREEIETGGLPLPPADYLAQTVEERLVMYADKFHSKSRPGSFLTVAAYRDQLRRFGAAKVDLFDTFVTEFGVPDLPALAARHAMTLHTG